MGVWYEISRYNTSNYHSDCVFNRIVEGTDSTFDNIFYFKALPDETTYKMTSKVSLTYPNENPLQGLLTLTVPNEPGESPSDFEIFQNILATDYDNFAILWSCDDIDDNSSIETAWILSRERQINPAVQSNLDSYIDKFLDRNLLSETEQNQNYCVFHGIDPNTMLELNDD